MTADFIALVKFKYQLKRSWQYQNILLLRRVEEFVKDSIVNLHTAIILKNASAL